MLKNIGACIASLLAMFIATTASAEIRCRTNDVFVLNSSVHRIDFVMFEDTDEALKFAGVKRQRADGQMELTPPGDYAIELWTESRKVEKGTSKMDIRRYKGGGTATFTFHYVQDSARFPDRMWYVSRHDVCLGYVSVTKIDKHTVMFQIPITEAGARPLIPMEQLKNNRDAVLPCITTSVPIYEYRLTAGPMKDMRNTTCGLPGSKPGTTRASELANKGIRWSMYTPYVKCSVIINGRSVCD